MNRAVYIGGFGNGQATADKVGEALMRHGNFDNVDTFTFGYAYKNMATVERAAKKVHTVAHSAGMMALQGARAEFIHAFNAPLPTGRLKLLAKTGLKTGQMLLDKGHYDEHTVLDFNKDSAAELIKHPVRNLGPFVKSEISRFDAVFAACEAVYSGVPVTLTYTDRDLYFKLSQESEDFLRHQDIDVVRMPGVHDELALSPDTVLGRYFQDQAAAA